jgi:hypothetical protein
MTNGKVIWVNADDVECIEGALIFYRVTEEAAEVVAGFNLQKVDHFGKSDAFINDKES